MKFLPRLRPSREKSLKIFFKYMPPPPEMMRRLEEAKVTNHVVLFLLPDMTTLYETFTKELTARSFPYEELSGMLRPKVRLPILKSVVAVLIPKIAVAGSQLEEVAIQTGMKPKPKPVPQIVN